MSKYGAPIWRIVLEAAKSLDKEVFQPKDVIEEVHRVQPEIPAVTIRTYVIAMAPGHPSSIHYPSTRKNHPCFDYLGDGKFRLDFTLSPVKLEKPRLMDREKAYKDRYGGVIRDWAEEHFDALVEGRRCYSWRDRPTVECVRERNAIQAAIVKSRFENWCVHGGSRKACRLITSQWLRFSTQATDKMDEKKKYNEFSRPVEYNPKGRDSK